MKTKLIGLGILAALVIVVGLSVNQIKTNSKTTLSAETVSSTTPDETRDGSLGVYKYARGGVRIGDKTFSVEIALTQEQQALGLGQRDSLARDAGMLFVFKPAQLRTFWMKDMRFDLDTVWIFDGKVVHISRRVPAPKSNVLPENLPTYSPGTEVDYVLEINAGAADGLKVGDRVEIINSSQV